MTLRVVAIALVASLLPAWCPWSHCRLKPDARSMWAAVLQQCAPSDLMKPGRYIFLGPATTYSPGDVLQETSDGYYLYFPLSAILKSADVILSRPQMASCDTSSDTEWNSKLGLPFSNVFGVIDFKLDSSLQRARKATVHVDQWSYVSLQISPYETLIDTLPTGLRRYKSDMARPDARVIKQAIAVKGMTATLDFSDNTSLAAALKKKMPTSSKVTLSNGGPSLSVSWTSKDTLALKSTAEFFVAAQPGQWIADTSGGHLRGKGGNAILRRVDAKSDESASNFSLGTRSSAIK
jgi:hypothetical protein